MFQFLDLPHQGTGHQKSLGSSVNWLNSVLSFYAGVQQQQKGV